VRLFRFEGRLQKIRAGRRESRLQEGISKQGRGLERQRDKRIARRLALGLAPRRPVLIELANAIGNGSSRRDRGCLIDFFELLHGARPETSGSGRAHSKDRLAPPGAGGGRDHGRRGGGGGRVGTSVLSTVVFSLKTSRE